MKISRSRNPTHQLLEIREGRIESPKLRDIARDLYREDHERTKALKAPMKAFRKIVKRGRVKVDTLKQDLQRTLSGIDSQLNRIKNPELADTYRYRIAVGLVEAHTHIKPNGFGGTSYRGEIGDYLRQLFVARASQITSEEIRRDAVISYFEYYANNMSSHVMFAYMGPNSERKAGTDRIVFGSFVANVNSLTEIVSANEPFEAARKRVLMAALSELPGYRRSHTLDYDDLIRFAATENGDLADAAYLKVIKLMEGSWPSIDHLIEKQFGYKFSTDLIPREPVFVNGRRVADENSPERLKERVEFLVGRIQSQRNKDLAYHHLSIRAMDMKMDFRKPWDSFGIALEWIGNIKDTQLAFKSMSYIIVNLKVNSELFRIAKAIDLLADDDLKSRSYVKLVENAMERAFAGSFSFENVQKLIIQMPNSEIARQETYLDMISRREEIAEYQRVVRGR